MSTEGNVEMVSTVIYTIIFFIISHPLYIKNEFSVYVLSMKEAYILAILHIADLLDMTHCLDRLHFFYFAFSLTVNSDSLSEKGDLFVLSDCTEDSSSVLARLVDELCVCLYCSV